MSDKMVEVDLKRAPMVMEELSLVYGNGFTRWDLPAYGPVILNEATNKPYRKYVFSPLWREIADAAGIPKNINNADARRPKEVEEEIDEDELDLDLEESGERPALTH